MFVTGFSLDPNEFQTCQNSHQKNLNLLQIDKKTNFEFKEQEMVQVKSRTMYVKQRLKAQVLKLSQLAGPMGKFSFLSVPTFLQSGAPGGLA